MQRAAKFPPWRWNCPPRPRVVRVDRQASAHGERDGRCANLRGLSSMSVTEQAPTGITGLDNVLAGGLTRGRVYLLEGSPGTGKTTIAMQFLLQGAAWGERGLYITLSETDDELRASAASHGWSLDDIDVYELVPPESL